MLPENMKTEILECLKNDRLHRVILFGSQAEQNSHADSDVDLLIVSDSKGVHTTYKDFLKHKNGISRKLIQLKKKYPLDVLVYTKDEWEFMLGRDTSFARDIVQKGIDLL